MMTELYACYNKDEDVRAKSSSGGIYYLLAKEILCNNGVVFASCYDGLKVKHQKIDDEKKLINSLGSKYIPSELGDTFLAVREEISSGKTVLFTGLPCQCAGLRSYINECVEVPRDNLMLVDLVCHGIPAPKAWDSYCESITNDNFRLSTVNMRDKTYGWKNYSLLLSDSDGEKRLESHKTNPYMKGFISNLYLRPICSNCKFKGVERETDITLGDYWGIQNIQPEMDDDKGTSLMFIHSDKGLELFEAIAGELEYTRAPLNEIIKQNPSIITSADHSDKRDDFFHLLSEGEDFVDIVEKMTKEPLNKRIKRKIESLVKKGTYGKLCR